MPPPDAEVGNSESGNGGKAITNEALTEVEETA